MHLLSHRPLHLWLLSSYVHLYENLSVLSLLHDSLGPSSCVSVFGFVFSLLSEYLLSCWLPVLHQAFNLLSFLQFSASSLSKPVLFRVSWLPACQPSSVSILQPWLMHVTYWAPAPQVPHGLCDLLWSPFPVSLSYPNLRLIVSLSGLGRLLVAVVIYGFICYYIYYLPQS